MLIVGEKIPLMYKFKSYRCSVLLCAAVSLEKGSKQAGKKRDELKGQWPKTEREEFTAKNNW